MRRLSKVHQHVEATPMQMSEHGTWRSPSLQHQKESMHILNSASGRNRLPQPEASPWEKMTKL